MRSSLFKSLMRVRMLHRIVLRRVALVRGFVGMSVRRSYGGGAVALSDAEGRVVDG